MRQIVGNIPDYDPAKNCEVHDFQFYPFTGTFCSKCNIEYGVECLKPGCKKHECKTHALSYDVFTQKTYADVLNDMTSETYAIHLAHDGVTSGEDNDIRKVFDHPNLKIVEYCGYYTDGNVCRIIDEIADNGDIKFVPIY